jgi:hypothetical protein
MRKLIILAPLAVAACGEPIRVGALPVPPHLLTCADEPPVPAQPSADERDGVIARYIVSLRDAGQSCRDNLAAVKVYVDQSK